MATVLKTKGLTKVYGNVKAVDDVSIHVEQGDIYGFVGANGAGKTTIMRMVTGLVTPTEGTIALFGTENTESGYEDMRKRVSAVVEMPSIYLNLTAKDNLCAQCKLLGVPEARAEEYLQTVGLGDMYTSKKKAKNFSLGMRQRLGIAMTLVGEPEFILLDEPMNGLDPQGIVEVRELIQQLNCERGVTFVISSHILDELAKVATRYGFISHGRLVKELSSEELHRMIRKCVEVTIGGDAHLAWSMLREKYASIESELLENGKIRLYGELTITDLVGCFVGTELQVLNVENIEENLEEFYLSVIGGKSK